MLTIIVIAILQWSQIVYSFFLKKVVMKKIFVYMLLWLFTLNSITTNAHRAYKGHEKSFDYIIVGFGSAGAILARKLSDGNKNSVLVLESGFNSMEDPAVLNPNLSVLVASNTVFNPSYTVTYPIPIAPLTAAAYIEGQGWGGSAAINAFIAARGVPSDWNQMAINAQNVRWAYNNVLPFMKAIETYTGITPNPTQRGHNGPIFITQNPSVENDPLAIALANYTGSVLVSDYNDALLPNCSTSTVQQFVTPNESRRSFSAYEFMTIGEIIDFKGRGLHGRKVRVMGNADVTRLLFDEKSKNSVIGVEYIRNKSDKKSEQVRKVYAKKKVILCAGSVNSPKILMLSGIGPKKKLRKLGIDVVLDNSNVGAHLKNHYGTTAIITDASATPGQQIDCFMNGFPYMPADQQRRLQAVILEASGMASAFGFLLHPQSVGSIELVSKDPLIQPKVNLNLFSDGTFLDVGSDAYLLVSYLKIIKAVAEINGGVVLSPSPADYTSDEALFKAASSPNNLSVEHHITSTARISKSIEDGVVDGNLLVHGIKNLMIADLSVMHPTTSGNTCLPVYIIGLVAADILLKKDE